MPFPMHLQSWTQWVGP